MKRSLEFTHQDDARPVQLVVLHVAFRLHPRLEEQGNDEEESGSQRRDHGLEGRPLRVDEPPRDVVIQGSISSAESGYVNTLLHSC